MIDDLSAFNTYLNLKLHFKKPSFNYFNIHNKNRIGRKALEARKDKRFFYSLSKKKDLENFLVSNFIIKDKHIVELLDKDSDKTYLDWLARQESLMYHFNNELEILDDDLNGELKVIDGQHPKLLTRFFRKEVSIETLIMINEVLTFFDYWTYNIQEEIMWIELKLKCEKYRPFLNFNKKICKDFLKKRFA